MLHFGKADPGKSMRQMQDETRELLVTATSRIFGVVVVNVSGEIDMSTAEAFRSALGPAHTEPVAVVSLENVLYIDSSGLAVLVGEHRRRRENGQRLLVVLPSSAASRVFRITQLTQVLECFDDLANASQAARSEPRQRFGCDVNASFDGKASPVVQQDS